MTSAAKAPQPTPAVTTEGCRYCWMCRQSCPVGFVTARETFTPHAWALEIESVRRGQLKWNPETVDVLYACADCGLCRAHCATDRPLPDAIAAARAEVVTSGAAPAAVYAIDRALKTNGTPYSNVVPEKPSAPRKNDVAIFIGDAGLHLSLAETDAAGNLLTRAGISAAIIGSGRSTGALASSLGLRDTALALARGILDEVAATGCRELIVFSPADRWAFEHVYPQRLGLAWPESVVIRDAVEVLDAAVSSGRLTLRPIGKARPYAYHDPCHTPSVRRDHGAPRRLLAAVLGAENARELFWREGRAHPCGAVGGLHLTQPRLAAQLAESRFRDAAAAGASWFLTEDPLCRHHLEKGSSPALEVRGLYSTLAEGMTD
jgi:Fe-S oxidoreductase